MNKNLLLYLLMLFGLSCTQKSQIQTDTTRYGLNASEIVVHLEKITQKEYAVHELIIKVTLTNHSQDSLIILNQQSSYFYQQFGFQLRNERQRIPLINRKNRYDSHEEWITIAVGDSVSFEFDLYQHSDDFPIHWRRNMNTYLTCFFDYSIADNPDEGTDFGIVVTGNHRSNEVQLTWE